MWQLCTVIQTFKLHPAFITSVWTNTAVMTVELLTQCTTAWLGTLLFKHCIIHTIILDTVADLLKHTVRKVAIGRQNGTIRPKANISENYWQFQNGAVFILYIHCWHIEVIIHQEIILIHVTSKVIIIPVLIIPKWIWLS